MTVGDIVGALLALLFIAIAVSVGMVGLWVCMNAISEAFDRWLDRNDK